MRTDIPQPVRLADYQPPAHLIDTVHLHFDLEPSATRVKARLVVRRNPDGSGPLKLNGERLKLISVAIDGQPLSANQYVVDDEWLTIADTPDAFTLETEVEIDPAANTWLEGLYMSGGRFCTQCEAEGFRKITYYPDRPDVMARFSVRIEADKAFQHLLSNGNLMGSGELPNGRHFAEWDDPFPKPAYLFALVGGTLDVLDDTFTTMSGRKVLLRIFVDPGMAHRAEYAMDALKRSMKWDEDTYGREYDLDLFMIVAVRDFNFGAMENKGLNIFNSSVLLADPETATDFDYARIESVVAHEYFHNWTGNRITCRDWFQLCLKEGFTVFRDQSFSADMRGAAVQRIKDVRVLRARQFAEDAGPLAHPVRPSSYLKIDNFYTATIYEKGSEIIRMLKTLLGAEAFRKGCDLYFERHDGQATTVEAFIACFAEASGLNLDPFFAWYRQAGRPLLDIDPQWDEHTRTLRLTMTQGRVGGERDDFGPVPIPVRLGLLDRDGAVQPFRFAGEEVEEAVLLLQDQAATFVLEGVARLPVISALRGLSAPVDLKRLSSDDDLLVLMGSDPDLFNRWQSAQTLAGKLILGRAAGQVDTSAEAAFVAAVARAIDDETAQPDFHALMLALPGEPELAQAMADADPAAIHAAREALRGALARALRSRLLALHAAMSDSGSFSPSGEAAGRRSLRNACLDLLAAAADAEIAVLADNHYRSAKNMTDTMGGLSALRLIGGVPFEAALEDFYARWKDEPLVLDKWFATQARDPSDGAFDRVRRLAGHPDFDRKTPNRLRALVQVFSGQNPARFHDPSGAGYVFLTDEILTVDRFNAMTAARLLEPLSRWRTYKPELGALMKAQLDRLAAQPELSKNVRELVEKALG